MTDGDLAEAALTDPRPEGGRDPVAPELLEDAVRVITEHARPIAPSGRVNDWELIELDSETDAWEVWSARHVGIGPQAPLARLKRYFLDGLAVQEQRENQRRLARQDLEALIRLAGTDGAVPVLSAVEETEGAISVVTDWPQGPVLASKLEEDELDEEDADELVEALITAVASVHAEGLVDRALSPDCAHVLTNGRVVLTDFDFSRVPEASSITHLLPQSWTGPLPAPPNSTGRRKGRVSPPTSGRSAGSVWRSSAPWMTA